MDALECASPRDEDTREVAERDDDVLVGEARGNDARDDGDQNANIVLDDAEREVGKRSRGSNGAPGGEM